MLEYSVTAIMKSAFALQTLHLEGNGDLRVLPEFLGRIRKLANVRLPT